MNTLDDEKKLDITYFSIDPNSFLNPDITEGEEIVKSQSKNPVVLDDSFKEQNISIGDILEGIL